MSARPAVAVCCSVLQVHLCRLAGGGPAAVHRCLVEGAGFEERGLGLGAGGLLVGEGSGAVPYVGVGPHRDLVHRPRGQVSSCKNNVHKMT